MEKSKHFVAKPVLASMKLLSPISLRVFHQYWNFLLLLEGKMYTFCYFYSYKSWPRQSAESKVILMTCSFHLGPLSRSFSQLFPKYCYHQYFPDPTSSKAARCCPQPHNSECPCCSSSPCLCFSPLNCKLEQESVILFSACSGWLGLCPKRPWDCLQFCFPKGDLLLLCTTESLRGGWCVGRWAQ